MNLLSSSGQEKATQAETANSPYLKRDRLAAVIAAIQVLGTRDWGTGPLEGWVRTLEGVEDVSQASNVNLDPEAIRKWRDVFEQHPEFFKLYLTGSELKATLRWRYAFRIDYRPETAEIVDAATVEGMGELRYNTVTRKPLSSDQIGVLINTAISLHSGALAEKRENHWFIPAIVAAISGLLTGVLTGTATVTAAFFLHK